MTKEQKEIDQLGPIGLLREALNVLWTHAKVFVLIQLTCMLGLAVVSVGTEYLLFKNTEHWSPSWRRHYDYGQYNRHKSESWIEAPFLQTISLWPATTVYQIVLQAGLCLSLSATLYSVGLHYAGQRVSFIEVIRASTPRLWMRLAVTTTYYLLISNPFLFVVKVMKYLFLFALDGNYVSSVWALWAASACVVAMGAFAYVLISIRVNFTLAAGVSVLEDEYGWAAMRKGGELLKGNYGVAFLFQLLLLVLGCIQGGLVGALGYEVRRFDFSALLALTVVIKIIWTTFFWQLLAVCSGVQYASFKAHPYKSITDSLDQKGAKAEECVCIVDESNEADLIPELVGR